MPDPINPLNIPNNPTRIALQNARTPQAVRTVLQRALDNGEITRENVDQFVVNGGANRAPIDLLNQVNRVRPQLQIPPPLPDGLTIERINQEGRIDGVNPQTVNAWRQAMLGLRGRTFNLNTNNLLQMANQTLDSQGARAPGTTPAQQAQALARAGWRDGFFSSQEMASAFIYARNLQNQNNQNNRDAFLTEFTQEFTRQVRDRYQDPNHQRYIMMQFTRFMNNTNWNRTDPSFRNFFDRLGNNLVQGLPAYEQQIRGLQHGQSFVAATYDVPRESNVYGAGFLRVHRVGNDIRTEVIRHRPAPPQNQWTFNFTERGRAAGPQQGPVWPRPGMGNQPLMTGQITRDTLVQLLRRGQRLDVPNFTALEYNQVQRDVARFSLANRDWLNNLTDAEKRQMLQFLANYASRAARVGIAPNNAAANEMTRLAGAYQRLAGPPP